MSPQPTAIATAQEPLPEPAIKPKAPEVHQLLSKSLPKEKVNSTIGDYNSYFIKGEEEKQDSREMVNQFYDVVTDFYEYGWGESFHFAPRLARETFAESLLRHEYYLAHRLNLEKGQVVIDCGAGVGGPLRNIQNFAGSNIFGLNNNDYQVKRGNELIAANFQSEHARMIKGDFNNIPFEANTFDAAYQIEATCHSNNRTKTFAEILRVLKPGSCFAGYEWAMTDKYDETNAHHREVKFGIEKGNALPPMCHTTDIDKHLRDAGFELVEAFDMCAEDRFGGKGTITWWNSLDANYKSMQGIRRSPAGRAMTDVFVRTLEAIKLAPKGSSEVSTMLNKAADALVESGKLDIFTPCYFFIARKPTQ
eukprot:Clim_evm13s205 gene=Clim_evmTU13s205